MKILPVLREIVAEAGMPGTEEPPATLLDRVRACQEPLSALLDSSAVDSWFNAVLEQFGYMYGRAWARAPSTGQIARWGALLRWAHRELSEWRNESDPLRHQLVAILVVTQYLSAGESLWPSMPPGLEANAELMAALARFVSGMSMKISASTSAPIWEQEAATSLQSLDALGDWAALRHTLPRFANVLRSGFLPPQAVLCLHRYKPVRLLQALANVRSSLAALHLVSFLPLTARLQLGIDCVNPHIRFAVIYVTLVVERNAAFQPADRELLRQLLLVVAADESVWKAWMLAFNQPPLDALQDSLGQAMATAPDTAVQAYVDSVTLSINPQQSRVVVAQCLRAFSSAAPLSRRQLLWTAAHRRWVAWDFDSAIPDRHLTDIAASELDYAIVGYSVECQTTQERDHAVQFIVQQLNASEYHWHASLSDALTARNRLLSRFQPYAHAMSVTAQPTDWFFQGHYPMMDTRGDEYIRLMFRAR